MLSTWTRHIKDPVEKERFEDYVKNSSLLLDRLQGILNELDASLDRSENSEGAFDNPNWAYLQAYRNGCRATIAKIKAYTDITPQGIK